MNATHGLRRAGRIGHVNLKVSNLERSLAFYEGVLGLRVTNRIGDAAAFLAYDGCFGRRRQRPCVTKQNRYI
jgi:catechol-2,3-dioxygenase